MRVPAAHDGTAPVPLWLQLHGIGGYASTELAPLAGAADEHGFAVVAPQGTYGSAGWGWRLDEHEIDLTRANSDIAFVEALIDHVAAGASVAGSWDLGAACSLERPVPLLAIHGQADDRYYFDGGLIHERPVRMRYGSDSVPDRAATMAARNGCETEPANETIGEGDLFESRAVLRMGFAHGPRARDPRSADPNRGITGFDRTLTL